ncbi:MAG: hypothetical protein PHS80_11960 [Methanothrix sp.]|nr:hypothetical protein [Methanothrix sp.]
MATPHVLKNAYLRVGGSDITSYLRSVKATIGYDERECTVMGNAAHWSIPGLEDWSIEVECNQDYTDNLLNELLDTWTGADAAVAIILKPNGATTSAANPKYTSNGRIFVDTPISGAVGDLATVSFTIKPGDGTALVRAVAD